MFVVGYLGQPGQGIMVPGCGHDEPMYLDIYLQFT